MTEIKENVSQGILEQLNEPEIWRIIAYNNDVTPFNIVFYVLKTVVPLTDQEAYDKTYEIHMFGESVVYRGSKEHCEKIGRALTTIKVEFKIENDFTEL
jgi:ATP-dependent Clp protease adapter protein ClpS